MYFVIQAKRKQYDAHILEATEAEAAMVSIVPILRSVDCLGISLKISVEKLQ